MELKTVGLTKQFGSKTAVNDLSIVLSNGVYGLLGANGAGKTTLMRLLCNLQEPTSGKILLNGENIAGLGEQYQSLLGYLPQHFAYYPDFTALDFLLYVAALKGLNEKAARKKSKELLEAVGLSGEGRHKIKTFSGGMKQRLGIAQAMLNNPRILILDEPTAGLDPKGRDEILEQISKLKKETGITVILVSHSMDDVARYVERIIVMNRGCVVYDDAPREVFRYYRELEEIGLAAPQVTYMMKDLQEHGYDVSDNVTTIDEAKDEIMRYFTRLAAAKKGNG